MEKDSMHLFSRINYIRFFVILTLSVISIVFQNCAQVSSSSTLANNSDGGSNGPQDTPTPPAPPPIIISERCSYGTSEMAPIGTICGDGTLYSGRSPDGNSPMYTTPCDSGQNFSGSACIGAIANITWNNGGSFQPTATGFTSTTSGSGNSIGLVSLQDSGSPYVAANDCKILNTANSGAGTYGHNDWYLPALNETIVLFNGKSLIGNFAAGVY